MPSTVRFREAYSHPELEVKFLVRGRTDGAAKMKAEEFKKMMANGFDVILIKGGKPNMWDVLEAYKRVKAAAAANARS